MIKVVEGNLLNMFEAGEFEAIAHGCNCIGVMGAGIAYQIKHRFPVAFYEYMKRYVASGLNLGDSQMVIYNENKQVIFNLMTQYFTHYNNGIPPFDIIAYQTALETMVSQLNLYFNEDKYKVIRVGIPRIGSGLAGGDVIGIEEVTRLVFENDERIELTIVDYKG